MAKLFDYECLNCKKQFKHRKNNKKYCSHECYAKRYGDVIKICEHCKKEFTTKYRFRTAKFCNQTCYLLNERPSTKTTKKCRTCNNDFAVTEFMYDKIFFCSKKCFHFDLRNGQEKLIKKNCLNCQKEFSVKYISRKKSFCTRSCATSGKFNASFGKSSAMKGRPAWNRGLTAKTDNRLAIGGEKISKTIAQKFVDNEQHHQTGGFITGYFESKKFNKSIFFRSSYEKKFLELAEEDENIINLIDAPFRIEYIFDGLHKNYVPDFLVETKDNIKKLIEIKPATLVYFDQNIAKHNAARKYCYVNNIEFEILTEENLFVPVCC